MAASDPKAASARSLEGFGLGIDFSFWQALSLKNLQVVTLHLLCVGMFYSQARQEDARGAPLQRLRLLQAVGVPKEIRQPVEFQGQFGMIIALAVLIDCQGEVIQKCSVFISGNQRTSLGYIVRS